MLQKAVSPEQQPENSQLKGGQYGYDKYHKVLGAVNTEGSKASATKSEQWNRPQTVKVTPAAFM